ncbi:hypothetical protein DIPPA_28089 [Diplonema papillatum]|nr:hypothetical protein DIPPA_28089 [Diplonema papillatum]
MFRAARMRLAAPQMMRGMRVLELANVLAGPTVGQYLGELGASVVKVETPSGDVTRTWRLPRETTPDDRSAYFRTANMNKRSIAVDIRTDAGLAIVHRLASESDVVLASYKPGDAEKLRVDYETLARLNPRVVYGEITGYGPANRRPGYDAIVQAEAGFQYINGDPDGPPTKLPVALMDLLAAHQLKQSVILALWQRDRTGAGSHVHVSLVKAAVSALANQASGYLHAGVVPARLGSDHPSICPYGTVFETKDAQLLVLAVGSDRQYATLCEELAVVVKPEHRTNVGRVKDAGRCKSGLAAAIGRRDRAPLLESLARLSVPAGAVNAMDDVFRMREANELVVRDEAGGFVGLRQVASDDFSPGGSPPEEESAYLPAPHKSEHAAPILESLGYSKDDIAALAASGVVVLP